MSPTEKLQQLLANGTELPDFKQLAMVLVKQGADITVQAITGDTRPTLLHILARTNKKGINNSEIAELVHINSDVLEQRGDYNRTVLQSLLDRLHWNLTFEDFKQSAMILVRLGADATQRGLTGKQHTLLHSLVDNNKNGVNNEEIAELVHINPTLLKLTNNENYTALQLVINKLLSNERSGLETRMFEFEFDGGKPYNVSTEELNKQKYEIENTRNDLQQSAMALVRLGADITHSTINAHPTLLHALACSKNKNGVNTDNMAELALLNPNILAFTDGNGRTPIHHLLTNNPDVTVDVIEKFLSPENLHLADNKYATLLHVYCARSQIEVLAA